MTIKITNKLTALLLAIIMAASAGVPAFASEVNLSLSSDENLFLVVHEDKDTSAGESSVSFKLLEKNKDSGGLKESSLTGKADFGAGLYDTDKEYTLDEFLRPGPCWFSTTDSFYGGKYYGRSDPETGEGEEPEVLSYAYYYELYPLDTMEGFPESTYMTTVENVRNETKEIKESYVVNGVSTDKATYNNSKNSGGAWKEKTKTSFVRELSRTLVDTKLTYTGLGTMTISGNTYPVYHFTKDEYYDVVNEYSKVYTLEVTESGGTIFIDPDSGSGNSGSAEAVQTVKASLPVPKISTPKKGKKKITVRWTKLSKKSQGKVDGIQIQISKNKKFTDAKTYTVSKKAKSKTIKKLSKKTRYYVRIRTYKGGSCSKWSKVKKIKTR